MPAPLRAIASMREQWKPERDRVLWAPVFLGIGIAIYFSLLQEPSITHALTGLATTFVVYLLLWRRGFAYLGFALLLVAGGFNAAVLRTHMVAAPQIAREVGPVMVTGTVLNITSPDIDDGVKRRQVTLGRLEIDRLAPEDTPARIRLSSYHMPQDVMAGDRIAVLAKLSPPSGPMAPRGFDYRRQVYFEQLGAMGFTLGQFRQVSAGAPDEVMQWFSALRRKIAVRINAVVPAPESAVTAALLAGERASIPKDVNADLRDSGLTHLLSISGVHVAIVCGSVFIALRFLLALWPYAALHWPIKKWAALAALLAGGFYTMLAGMPVPTVRSMMMTGLVLLAAMLDRSALSMRTIALAAVVVLLFYPDALIGASFQLSFAAVLSMIAFYEGAGRKWFIADKTRGTASKLFLYFAGIGVTTMLVSFATLPPILHHFGRVQLWGIVGNAVAIPITSFIVMPFGMLALLFMPLGWEAPFLHVAYWGVAAILDVAAFVAALPYAVIAAPGVPVAYFMAASIGFLWLCLWQGAWRYAGAVLMVSAITAGMLAPRADALIDREARSLGVRGAGQAAYVVRAPRDFVRRNWEGFWGVDAYQDAKPVREGGWQSGAFSAVCDDDACRIAHARGAALSVVKNVAALRDECAWADVVILATRAAYEMECAVPALNHYDIRRGGGYAFYVEGARFIAKPFVDPGTHRPWTLKAP